MPIQPSEEELEVSSLALRNTPSTTAYARVDMVYLDDSPLLMELELIEPEIFLPRTAQSSKRFADELEKSFKEIDKVPI